MTILSFILGCVSLAICLLIGFFFLQLAVGIVAVIVSVGWAVVQSIWKFLFGEPEK